MFDLLITMWLLLLRAHAVAPYDKLEAADALTHGMAMVLASSADVSEQEIARIARRESGFWVDARPRMKHWPHVASKFPRKKHHICGLMQATARTPAECVSWIKNPFLAYQAGADQVRRWHAHCRRIGRYGARRYRCARAGYAKGVEAARDA